MKSKIYRILLVHFDKVCHALLGTILFVMLNIVIDSLFALIASIVLGISIEVYDYLSKKGTPDFLDAIATFLIPLIIYLTY
jgi:hypothetical protein